jgi:hypothetical protein
MTEQSLFFSTYDPRAATINGLFKKPPSSQISAIYPKYKKAEFYLCSLQYILGKLSYRAKKVKRKDFKNPVIEVD